LDQADYRKRRRCGGLQPPTSPTLTLRRHEIMNLVIAGHPSKNNAADLGISQHTV
jgi:FixJ family two-component response regulator